MRSTSYKFLLSICLLLVTAGAHAQLINTVAGTGIAGAGSGGGPATSSELAAPTGIGIDPSTGDVYIADSANNIIHKVDHVTGIITTVAGGGITGLGDGGPATFGMLSGPTGVCVDAFHNIYIADYGNNRIRKVIYSSGVITTIVNTTGAPGVYGYTGDGGSALLAKIHNPYGVRIDGTGNLFIADQGNNCIREVSGGIINTVAGTGFAGLGLDGGPATSAEFDQPVGVTVDYSNNIYIADQANNVIREVNGVTGMVSTIAGNALALAGYGGDGAAATNAKLSAPTGVAYDNAAGNLYIADMGNNCIRMVNMGTGIISTVVNKAFAPALGYSGDGGLATAAHLNQPTGVYLTGSGASLTLYIADAGNNVIRKVALGSTRIITTIAGNNGLAAGYGLGTGDGGSATATDLNNPTSITMDGSGNLYIADASNNRVREVLTTGGIAAASITTGGSGYVTGDVVSVVGGTATATVTAVAGVVTGIAIVPGAGYSTGIAATTAVTGSGVGLVLNITVIDPTIITFAGTGIGACPSCTSGDGNPATAAGVRVAHPTGVAYDAVQNCIYISEHDSDNVRMVPLAIPTHIISTITGLNSGAYAGDGALAVNAKIFHPYGVAVDQNSNVYIGDADNERIREVFFDPGSGIKRNRIYTVAGNSWGDVGYGGLASYISLRNPSGVALTTAGEMYIADQGNHLVRKVDIHGVMHVIAGTGVAGYSGDGGNATDAQLYYPYGVAFDNTHPGGSGTLYIADEANDRIRKINVATGVITTVAGNGTAGYTTDGVVGTTTDINTPTGLDVNQASGDIYIADRNNNRSRKVTYAGDIISTYAGTGVYGYLASGGPATAAELNQPYATAVDTFGNIYIADRSNNLIRKVSQVTGAITNIAGSAGPAGYAGDGGPGSLAILDGPNGIAIDPTFKILYFSDAGNDVIRKIDLTTGNISLFAGNPTPITGVGYVNGPATASAKFYYPAGVCTDPAGNVYVADVNNNVIRKISGGTVTTVAGSGPYSAGCTGRGGSPTSAELNSPTGVAFNKAGTTMYIADFGNDAVLAVTGGTLSLFAGADCGTAGYAGDGGPAASALLSDPASVATDASGNVFISDFGNNCIRMVNTSGVIKTVAGQGPPVAPGYTGDGGAAPLATMHSPYGISVDTGGNYYIADMENSVIRKVTTVLLASFTTTGTSICQDSCVTFYNTSIGNTDSIRWSTTAPGATISAGTSDTTTICFPTAGSYVVNLKIYYKGKSNTSSTPILISPTPVPVIGQSGFTLSVSGAYSGYQWNMGGTPISGAVLAAYVFTVGGTYTVTVDSNGCPGTSGPITVTMPTTNINILGSTSQYKYWLSPSPQDVNTVTLHASQMLADDMKVSVFDGTGREILDDHWTKGTNTLGLSSPSLPPGLYLIKLTNASTSTVLKWQKE